jgi:hypothetical protein
MTFDVVILVVGIVLLLVSIAAGEWWFNGGDRK